MKSKRLITTLTGFSLFLAIVAGCAWLLAPAEAPGAIELSADQVKILIRDRRIKEAYFKRTRVELVDVKAERFFAEPAGETARESILEHLIEFNKDNPKAFIKYRVEPASTGPSGNLTNYSMKLLFFLTWSLALAVIVYAARTLSRNKG